MSVKTHNKTKLVPVNRSVALLPERDASISPILECIDLGVTFGGLKAVDNFDITIGRTENRRIFWKVRAMPARLTCAVVMPWISFPSSRMVPWVG